MISKFDVNKGLGSILAICAGILGAVSANIAKTNALHDLPWVFVGSGMFMVNAIAMATFSAALKRTTSLHATALSVASNTLGSGILGWVVYLEPISLRWMVGVSCLVVGAVLVQPQDPSGIGDRRTRPLLRSRTLRS